MHPSAVWLTRLEMNLPRDQLVMDCRAGRSGDTAVSNQLTARTYKGNPCPGGMVAVGTASPSFMPLPWMAGSFTLLGLLRRRRKSA
jgi:hypothetical protein